MQINEAFNLYSEVIVITLPLKNNYNVSCLYIIKLHVIV